MRILFVSILLIIICNVSGQDIHVIDSLKSEIKNAENDTTVIITYYNLGDQYWYSNPDTAKMYYLMSSEKAESFLKTNPKVDLADVAKIYLATAINDIGLIFVNQSNKSEALIYYNKSIRIFGEISKLPREATAVEGKMGLADSYSNVGYVYQMSGNINEALEYFTKSLNIREETNDKTGLAHAYNNLAVIYNNQGDRSKALEYYKSCLRIYTEIQNKTGIANSHNNIGYTYYNQADLLDPQGDHSLYDSLNNLAIDHFTSGLEIFEEIGDKKSIACGLSNIGTVYDRYAINEDPYYKNEASDSLVKKAIEYYRKSLKIKREIEDKDGIVISLLNLGTISHRQNNISQYKAYANEGYKISKELGYPERIEEACSLMKFVSIIEGNYQKAYEYYKEEIAMRDSVQNEKNYKAVQKQQARYEYQKQKAVDSVAHHKAIEIKDLSIAKKEEETKKQRAIIYSFVVGFIVILIFLIIIYRMFVQKKRANKIITEKNELLILANEEILNQKEEIMAQRDEITVQRDEIANHRDIVVHQKEAIEDSIRYAKRIQTAILPTEQYADSILGEYFIMFKPKDVVSGDFYWATQTDDWTIVTVADCTGHGVPGAFMSMLGVSFLNEIVRKKDITTPAMVLNQLRVSVIEALSQTGEDLVPPKASAVVQGTHLTAGAVKDGMDMSLLAISKDKKKGQWAGANNPLWIIRNREVKTLHGAPPLTDPVNNIEDHLHDVSVIEEIKGDKMPVSVHLRMDNFTNHEIELEAGDRIYLFTDGYPDQFGGERGKKLKYKPFKRILTESSNLPMKEQGNRLEEEFDSWINGYSEKHPQIDDITIIGLKI